MLCKLHDFQSQEEKSKEKRWHDFEEENKIKKEVYGRSFLSNFKLTRTRVLQVFRQNVSKLIKVENQKVKPLLVIMCGID